MKGIKILILITIATIFQLGCTKDYLSFDEDLASVRFIYESSNADSITYSFALHPDKNQDIISLPLQIIGLTKSFSREVAVDYDKEATTAMFGEDFEIEHCIIPENSVKGMLNIVIKKTKDLEDKNVVVSVVLKENENFIEPPENESRFNIVLTDKLSRPTDWPGDFEPYSRVKHEFVIEVTGLGTDYGNWSEQELIYNLGLLNTALYEYNKNHPGEPLTDENGLTVTF